jgi:S1-C subfamily serine protease
MRHALAVGLFLTVFHPAFGQKDISVETMNIVKKSIVPIVCGYVDERAVFQLVHVVGTGFFVGTDGRLITAAHVMDDEAWKTIRETKHPCFAAFYIPDHGWRGFEKTTPMQWFPIVSCIKNPIVDLAICTPAENPFTSARVPKENIAAVSFDTTTWQEGTPVAFSGFPLQLTSPMSSKAFVGGYTFIAGTEAGFDYIIDKSAWPGASESPLYLSNGKAIGIILAAGRNEGSGLAFARSAATVADFLKQNPPTNPKK